MCVSYCRTGKDRHAMLSTAFSLWVMSSTATSSSLPTTAGTLATPCATTTTPTSAPATKTMINVWITALLCAKVNWVPLRTVGAVIQSLYYNNIFPPNEHKVHFVFFTSFQVATGTTAALIQTWMGFFTATVSTQRTQMGSLGTAGTGPTTPWRKWRWRSGQWNFNHKCLSCESWIKIIPTNTERSHSYRWNKCLS